MLLTVAAILVPILFIASIGLGLWGHLPNRGELSQINYPAASEVYTADSVLIGKYFLIDGRPIPFEDMPRDAVQALIATEDARFYEHSGIDYPSVFRVAFKTVLLQNNASGGGSTISQQLTKNLYPRAERNKTSLVIDKIKVDLLHLTGH